jgi:hypothetical protein
MKILEIMHINGLLIYNFTSLTIHIGAFEGIYDYSSDVLPRTSVYLKKPSPVIKI